jgi:hypothetical protein
VAGLRPAILFVWAWLVVLPLKQDNNQAAMGVLNIAAASFGVLYARAE